MPNLPAFFFVGLSILSVFFVGLRWFAKRQARVCGTCYYTEKYCVCDLGCQHDDTYPARWTQDGWMTRCKQCRTILYLGDDYNNRPE